jgi:lipopolysaccharide transport protein LptA
MNIYRFVFFAILISAGLIPCRAEEPAEDRLTEITSERLHFDYANKRAVFTGNVVVSDPDMQIDSDELTIFMNEDDSVNRIEAKGNVIIRSEGLHSRSGSAVYTLADQRIVLEREPQVFREGSILTAERIIYFRAEERMVAEPRPRIILFQEGDRDLRF